MKNIIQLLKLKLIIFLQRNQDKNILSWNKTGDNCKYASYECQDTGIFCHLLKKRCNPVNCKYWKNQN